MRIERIRLRNFIGIRDGVGREVVDIDFEKAREAGSVIMLAGGNGSGKTTLLSHLQPFATNNDGRRHTVVPGLPGRKEIWIRDGDARYRATHVYEPKKNADSHRVRSFIAEVGSDGETELNENGGVRGFADLAEERLGITKDFFRVGRIGSNVGNFIDLNSSDRKRYIGRFLPNVEPYLKSNAAASENLKAVNKVNAFLSRELERIGDRDGLDEQLERMETERVAVSNTLEDAKVDAAVLKERIRVGNEEVEKVTRGGRLFSELSLLRRKADNASRIRQSLPHDMSTAEEIREKIRKVQDEALRHKALKAEKEREASMMMQIVSSEKESVKRMEMLIDESGRRRERLEALEKAKLQVIRDLEKCGRDLSGPIARHVKDLAKEAGHDALGREIDKASERCAAFVSDIRNLRMDAMEMSEFMPKSWDALDAIISDLKFRIAKAEEKTERLEDDIMKTGVGALIHSDLHSMSGFRHCGDPECPYEDIASKADMETRNGLQKALSTCDREREEMDGRLEMMHSTKNLIADAKMLFRNAGSLEDILPMVHMDKESWEAFAAFHGDALKSLRTLMKTDGFSMTCSKARDALGALRTVKALEGKLADIVESITAMSGDDNGDRSMKAELDGMRESLARHGSEMGLMRSQAQNAADEVVRLNKEAALLTKKAEGLENIEAEEKLLHILEKEREKAVALKDGIRKDELSLAEVEGGISEMDESLSSIQESIVNAMAEIRRLDEYEAQKASIQGKHRVLAIVRRATNVIEGIPLYLIRGYLERIRRLTNDLLAVAYSGSFHLEPFSLTPTDFHIPVRKSNGSRCMDILDTSQGEVSLTKTALSFAIFKYALGRYDILALDEIDATLDAANRESFISMLDRQIEEIGLEQIFVISHNRNFYESDLGLVCFKGHGLDLADKAFMLNKVVLADFEED